MDVVSVNDGVRIVNNLNKKCLQCETIYHFIFCVFKRLMFSLFYPML